MKWACSKYRRYYSILHKQWYRPASKQFLKLPYSLPKATRSTRIEVAYPQPAFSVTQRINRHAPTSLMTYKPKLLKATRREEMRKIEIPRSMVLMEALSWLVKLAREPVFSRSNPRASLESVPRILPVRRFFLALVGTKQTAVRNKLFPQKSPGSRHWTLARRRSSCPPPSPNLVHTHPIECCCALPGFP